MTEDNLERIVNERKKELNRLEKEESERIRREAERIRDADRIRREAEYNTRGYERTHPKRSVYQKYNLGTKIAKWVFVLGVTGTVLYLGYHQSKIKPEKDRTEQATDYNNKTKTSANTNIANTVEDKKKQVTSPVKKVLVPNTTRQPYDPNKNESSSNAKIELSAEEKTKLAVDRRDQRRTQPIQRYEQKESSPDNQQPNTSTNVGEIQRYEQKEHSPNTQQSDATNNTNRTSSNNINAWQQERRALRATGQEQSRGSYNWTDPNSRYYKERGISSPTDRRTSNPTSNPYKSGWRTTGDNQAEENSNAADNISVEQVELNSENTKNMVSARKTRTGRREKEPKIFYYGRNYKVNEVSPLDKPPEELYVPVPGHSYVINDSIFACQSKISGKDAFVFLLRNPIVYKTITTQRFDDLYRDRKVMDVTEIDKTRRQMEMSKFLNR